MSESPDFLNADHAIILSANWFREICVPELCIFLRDWNFPLM